MRAASPSRWRLAWSTGCSALALAVAGAACGGTEREALPPDVGAELASAAGDVTAALEAGDPVAARSEADELLAAVEAALAGGDVPPGLAEEVRRGAERLAALVEAAQPPPPPPEPPPAGGDDDDDDGENGNGKKKDRGGKGKGKGKDGGDG